MKENKILYYQKAQEFLWLWEEIGSKREAQKWMKKLEKTHERAIQEGWLIDYDGLTVKEPFAKSKRTFTSVPSSNTPPNSLKSRDLKDKPKKVFVNRYGRNTDRKASAKSKPSPKPCEK
jgi:hypothetical protein